MKDLWKDLILPLRLMRLMMLEPASQRKEVAASQLVLQVQSQDGSNICSMFLRSWAPALQSLSDVVWMQAADARIARKGTGGSKHQAFLGAESLQCCAVCVRLPPF